jgi:hypothetical protein
MFNSLLIDRFWNNFLNNIIAFLNTPEMLTKFGLNPINITKWQSGIENAIWSLDVSKFAKLVKIVNIWFSGDEKWPLKAFKWTFKTDLLEESKILQQVRDKLGTDMSYNFMENLRNYKAVNITDNMLSVLWKHLTGWLALYKAKVPKYLGDKKQLILK